MSANTHPLGNVQSTVNSRILKLETRLTNVRYLLTRLEAEKQQMESLRKAAESELRDICFGPGCDELG
jgi:hypothetical protein